MFNINNFELARIRMLFNYISKTSVNHLGFCQIKKNGQFISFCIKINNNVAT